MSGRTRVPPRPPLRALVSLAGLLACVGGAGCVILNPSANDIVTIDAPPRGQFDPLGELMGKRCGTLDCHGQVGRNLRIYSAYGLRLSPNDTPGSSMLPTKAELDADYASAIALEPEIMSQVVQDGGNNPDRLTLVRKPRAEEHHKGGQLFVIGDPQDLCMTSWLAGNIDTTSCTVAITTYP